MFNKKFKTHWFIFSGAFLVRLLFFIALSIWVTNLSSFSPEKKAYFPALNSDSEGYLQIAENLNEYGSFSESPEPPLIPNSFRTPLYSTFIAGILALGAGKIGVIIIQIILASLTSVLIYMLGIKFLSYKVALLAAILFAIEPYSIFISGIMLTETLFTFLLVLSIYLFTKNSNFKNELLLKGGAGIVLGLTTLTRPLTIFLIPLGFLIIILMKWRKFRIQLTVLLAIVFLSGSLLTLVPWMIRNNNTFGTYELSSNGPHNALFWNISAHQALNTGESQDKIVKDYEVQISDTASREDLKSFEWTPKIKEIVVSYMKENLLSYSKFHLVKTVPFFVSDGFREIGSFLQIKPEKPLPNFTNAFLKGDINELVNGIRQGGMFTVIFLSGVILWSLVSLLMLVGTIAGLRKGVATAWFIFISASLIIYLAVISAPLSPGRMRVVAEPFIFLLTALGIQTIYNWWRTRFTKYS
jgi:4-amino-4-deoxy-L-arabinose transferase-like glycosyltransferase